MPSAKKPSRSSPAKPTAKAKGGASKPAEKKEKPVEKPHAKPAAAKEAREVKETKEVVRPVKEKEPPPNIILTAADREWLAGIREALFQRRAAINSVVAANRDQLAANEGDPSDIADRASDGFEDELTAGLLTIESAQLEQIDEALARIEKGIYGVCLDCNKPIPRKRLDVLPFAKRCLKCEGESERRRMMGHPGGPDEEDEEEEAEE